MSYLLTRKLNILYREKSLNTYVKNSDYKGEISGMLLYPTVEYDLKQEYKLSGNKVYIKTVDLNKDFEDISEALMEISKLV